MGVKLLVLKTNVCSSNCTRVVGMQPRKHTRLRKFLLKTKRANSEEFCNSEKGGRLSGQL
jgi:hypothetical protein